MTALALPLELRPVELLQRLPRRAGTFLLDGGGADSWGSGEALLGCEPVFVTTTAAGGDPFAVPEALLRDSALAGVAVALAYDLARAVERLAAGPPDDLALPRLHASAHPWVLAYCWRQRHYELRAPALSRPALQAVADRLLRLADAPPSAVAGGGAPLCPRSSFSRAGYLAAVQRVQEYIAAGDVYQVNLSQRFRAPLDAPPAALFARMATRHPAPWAAYLDGGPFALLSSSPECFLQRRGARVSTFPIKGTRPRGDDEARDKAMASDLLSSVKDGAEHLMIVDLERNDLGRVCRYGSVGVPRFAALRTFPSLHHLESEVCGELRPETSLAELLRATFPGGSITGAPKVRAMQIVDEIEPVARGFYTGCLGFVEAGGDARFNIAIRTAVATEREVSYHAGGGIVADSMPADEYDETLLKARAFLEALRAHD